MTTEPQTDQSSSLTVTEAKQPMPPDMTRRVLRREDLLKLLEHEIGKLEGEAERSGRTPWVLSAAAAALLWTLLGELSGSATLRSTALFVPLMLALLDALMLVLMPLRPTQLQTQGQRILLIRSLFDGHRLTVALYVLRFAGISALFYHNARTWGVPLLWLLVVPYALIAVSILLTIVLSLLPIPLVMQPHKKGSPASTFVLNLLFPGAMMAGVVAAIRSVYGNAPDDLVSALRVSAILVGLVKLLEWHFATSSNPSQLTVLVSLRRTYSFGDLTDEQFRDRLEQTLLGSSIAPFLHKDLQHVRATYDDAEQIFGRLKKEADAILHLRAAQATGVPANDVVLDSLLSTFQSRLKEAQAAIKLIEAAMNRYSRNSSILLRLAPEVGDEVKALTDNLELSRQKYVQAAEVALDAAQQIRRDEKDPGATPQLAAVTEKAG